MIRILVQTPACKNTIEFMKECCNRLIDAGINIKSFNVNEKRFRTTNCDIKFISLCAGPNETKGCRNYDAVYGFTWADRTAITKTHTADEPKLSLFDYICNAEKESIDG